MFWIIVSGISAVISVPSFLVIKWFPVALLVSPSIIGTFIFIEASNPMNKFGPIIPTVAAVVVATSTSTIVGFIMGQLGWAAFSRK